MTSTRWARFTRGWLVAAFSVFVAVLSHSLAGGQAPGWLSVVLALAFAGMLSVGLAAPAAALSRWRLVVSVAGSQLLFHSLFALLGAPAATSRAAVASEALAGHAGHHMSQAQIAAQLAATARPAGHPALAGAGHGELWMLLGHAVAGLLTIAAVLWGEHAAQGIARTAGLALRGLLALPAVIVPAPHTEPPRPSAVLWIPRPLDVVHASLRHRGPPARVLTGATA